MPSNRSSRHLRPRSGAGCAGLAEAGLQPHTDRCASVRNQQPPGAVRRQFSGVAGRHRQCVGAARPRRAISASRPTTAIFLRPPRGCRCWSCTAPTPTPMPRVSGPTASATISPFDFGRDAVLPGGGTARVAFSLAFPTDPAMPGIASSPASSVTRRNCSGRRSISVIPTAPSWRGRGGDVGGEPAAHRDFLERLTEGTAELAPGRLTIGERGNHITLLGPSELARPVTGPREQRSAAFAARLAVADLDATGRTLKHNGVGFAMTGAVLLVPPATAHGLALEFVEQEAN